MFIPKWLLGLLFFIAIGSTIGLLVLLSERQGSVSLVASATPANMVIVSPSASPTLVPTLTPSASSSALSSTAEWKTHTSPDLSLKFDYPTNWSVQSTRSGELVVRDISEATSSSQEQVKVVITRVKKLSTTSKVETFLQNRQEYYSTTFKTATIVMSSTRTIDGYDAVMRVLDTGSAPFDEIVFATKNFFYIVDVVPHASPLQVMVDELLKSIEII